MDISLSPLSNFLLNTGVFTFVNSLLMLLLKNHLDKSVKHEYDQIMLKLQSIENRKSVLFEERLNAFKSISTILLGLQRYCRARISEIESISEFESTTEALSKNENISLLLHSEKFEKSIGENAIFFSEKTMNKIYELRIILGMGCSMELYLDNDFNENEINSVSSYMAIMDSSKSVRQSLFNELGFDSDLETP